MKTFHAGVKTPATLMRLVPRFSLRFAFIALTIFLIVFGVGVKYWREYQEHIACVEKLRAKDWTVKEEEKRVLGIYVGKKITSLVFQNINSTDYLDALQELPVSLELYRFGILFEPVSPENLPRVMRVLEQSPALEELYLTNVSFTPQQCEQLAKLSKLQVLNLFQSEFPDGKLSFLKQMPQLHSLRLRNSHFDIEDFIKNPLPQLQMLDLTGVELPAVRFDRNHWGKFTALETMLFGSANIGSIICEPAAMPKLRHLELCEQTRDCKIDWAQLTLAAPQLTTLALHVSQYNMDSDSALRRFKHLKWVLFGDFPFDELELEQTEMKLVTVGKHRISLAPAKESLLVAWMNSCPQIQFSADTGDFLRVIEPFVSEVKNSPYKRGWKGD